PRSGWWRPFRRVVRAAAAARHGDRDRLRRRRVACRRAGTARRAQRRACRVLPRPAAAARSRPRRRGGRRAARPLAHRGAEPARRRGASARRGRACPRARRVAAEHREGSAPPVNVLITGGRGGLGRAFAEALRDVEVTALDLPEFDVGDSAAWRALPGSYDAAFLNAGVVTGTSDMAALTDEQYRRALGANIDRVV